MTRGQPGVQITPKPDAMRGVPTSQKPFSAGAQAQGRVRREVRVRPPERGFSHEGCGQVPPCQASCRAEVKSFGVGTCSGLSCISPCLPPEQDTEYIAACLYSVRGNFTQQRSQVSITLCTGQGGFDRGTSSLQRSRIAEYKVAHPCQ